MHNYWFGFVGNVLGTALQRDNFGKRMDLSTADLGTEDHIWMIGWNDGAYADTIQI